MRIYWFCSLFFFCLSAQAKKENNSICQKTIELKEFTTLELPLLPHLGTRLIFPFILNEQSNALPYDAKVTNKSIFSVVRSKGTTHNSALVSVNIEPYQEAKGQKDFVEYLGGLYISVGDYNITVRLKTTDSLQKHCDDIIFTISEEKRKYLIESEIQYRIKEYEKLHEEKMRQVDKLAFNNAKKQIAKLATENRKKRNVFEEKQFQLEKGGELYVHASHFLEYPSTNILVFKLENDGTKAINILDIDLLETKKGKTLYQYDTSYYCADNLPSGKKEECAIIVDKKSVFDARELTLHIKTDRGEVKLKW